MNAGIVPPDDPHRELIAIERQIGPIAAPDTIYRRAGLPKTRSGRIKRRILRKIAENGPGIIGDISSLVDPSVVEQLLAEPKVQMRKPG